jgi:hypothetical protein
MFEYSRGELRAILRDVAFNYALEIGQDAAGNAWLATDALGAAKIEARGFASFGHADGLGPVPTGLIIDNGGNVVVPNWPRQIDILAGERFHTVKLRFSPKADFTGTHYCLIQDHAGEWWAATSAGLYRFPRVRRAQDLANVSPSAIFTRREGLGDDEVWDPFEDAVGDIWVSGPSSPQPTVSRWERRTGRVFHYSTGDGLPAGGDLLMGTVQDSAKSLWFAYSEGGLARYREGRFQVFGEAQGLASARMAGIAVDPRGQVWCSIVGHGLARIDDSNGERLKVTTFPLTENITYNKTGAPVFADSHGRVYVGLLHGVDRLDPSTSVVTHYGAADGVPDGPIWCIAADRKGAIWFSTKKNVGRIVPDAARESAPGPVLLSGLKVSGVEYQLPATGARSLELKELSYQKNSLQIEFLSLAFAAGQAPLFQYRLSGADSDWSAASTLGAVNYANLAPGEYRFEVRQVARVSDSVLDAAQLTFRILQPVWKQNWFIGAVLLLGMGSLAGFERYRAAKMRQLRSAMAALRNANEALDIESAISRILAQSSDESAFPILLETLCRKTGWQRGALWQSDRHTGLLREAAKWPADAISAGAAEDTIRKSVDSKQVQWIAAPAGHACFPIVVVPKILSVNRWIRNRCSGLPRRRATPASRSWWARPRWVCLNSRRTARAIGRAAKRKRSVRSAACWGNGWNGCAPSALCIAVRRNESQKSNVYEGALPWTFTTISVPA